MLIQLDELARQLDAELRGDGQLVIDGLNTLIDAQAGQLSFLANSRYKNQLTSTRASAVIVAPGLAGLAPCAALVINDPYLAFARASQLFDNRPKVSTGIHPSAVIADTAVLGENICIGPNVVVGAHTRIGDGCQLSAGTVIGERCVLGQHCQLNPNVTLYHHVVLGDRVRIHSSSVIGADGFGFAPDQGRWHKIAQLGSVRIGNDVEIGASTTIDRGALGDTVIEDDVIMDNQIQIGHNTRIGQGTAIVSSVAIAGSTDIGKHCTIAGGAAIAGHLSITDNVHIAGMSVISKSISEPGAYASGTAQMPMQEWRRSAARFRQLDDMAKRLQQLEKIQQGKD